MNKTIIMGLCVLASSLPGCTAPPEPQITPPAPAFTDATTPPNPNDHRMYADVGTQDAIVIEWKPDSSGNTSGYILYRSIGDSTVAADGLLSNRTTVAQLESSNQFIEPLATSYKDTTAIAPGATYYYQLQAFYRSPSNNLTYSPPTHVDLSTSFTYAKRVNLLSPNGVDTLHAFPLKFLWQDPNQGGRFQIIVQRLDNLEYVLSAIDQDFGSTLTLEYPPSAPPLVTDIPYRWRIKWLDTFGGSSSGWMAFTVTP